MLDPVNLTVAVALGGSAFFALASGGFMLKERDRFIKANRRLENIKAINYQDAYQFVATPTVMCGGCGLVVPVGPDNLHAAEHDCEFRKQSDLFSGSRVDIKV